jgi:hypothetical protein
LKGVLYISAIEYFGNFFHLAKLIINNEYYHEKVFI